jgi:methionine sulfoxide reductase heme-binding subunit
MNRRALPWYDYSGRVSPLKTAVLASLFVPGLWITVSYALGLLGARPLTEAIHEFGDWTIRLIFIALAVSPARAVLQWPQLLQVRRMIGVAAFAYAFVHLSLYAADQAFNLATVASEIVLRIYLTIGFTALIGLGVLALTSTDGWQRSLGARRWQKLHRIVYGIGLLAVIHYFLQSKLNEWEPTVMAGIFVWLMGCRAVAWRFGKGKISVRAMAALSIAAGLLTAFGEAAYFWLAMGAPFGLVVMANLSLETGLRPSWVVLASTGGLTLLGAARLIIKPRAKARLRAPA